MSGDRRQAAQTEAGAAAGVTLCARPPVERGFIPPGRAVPAASCAGQQAQVAALLQPAVQRLAGEVRPQAGERPLRRTVGQPPGKSTRNSSPPQRASRSASARPAWASRTRPQSTSSPARWPWVSSTVLKNSTSISASATGPEAAALQLLFHAVAIRRVGERPPARKPRYRSATWPPPSTCRGQPARCPGTAHAAPRPCRPRRNSRHQDEEDVLAQGSVVLVAQQPALRKLPSSRQTHRSCGSWRRGAIGPAAVVGRRRDRLKGGDAGCAAPPQATPSGAPRVVSPASRLRSRPSCLAA